MHVLALVTQKGGTGKSSLATSLAVAAQEKGLRVSIIDIDPQGTASAWFQRRQDDAPDVAAMSWSYLSSQIYTLERAGFDLAIVDTPGANDAAASAAMREANFCLIPVRPSIADVEAAKATIRYLNERDKPFAFVLNQCPAGGRTSRTTNAARALELISTVCDTTLAFRADHMDAMASGRGVTEQAPSGKAAAETRALLDWLLVRLKRADLKDSEAEKRSASMA